MLSCFNTGYKRWVWLVFALLYLKLAPAHAQVSPNIPPTDPVYRDLRRLQAEGLLDSLMVASRPLTRLEVSKLLSQAEKKYHTEHPQREHPLLTRLQTRYGLSQWPNSESGWRGWWGAMRMRSLDAYYLGIREPSRPIPGTNALTSPFLRDREGRRFDQGDNIAVEADANWQIASRAIVSGRVRWQNHLESLGGGNVQLLSLYAKVNPFGPLVLQLGRDSIGWGYNTSGSLGIGPNAKPFDMIKISTRKPLSGPWILRHLGPIRPLAFLTHLGDDRQDFKRPYLLGTRVDTAPHRAVQVGVYRWMQFGGSGAPGNSTLGFIGDFFGIRPGNFNRETDTVFTRHINNGVGVDTQWRLPYLNGIILFGEVFWEDGERIDAFDGKLSFIPKPFLDWSASKTYGFSIWSLLDHNRLGLHIERVDTWFAAYTHTQYSSGLTYNRSILGHDLGPSGNGWYFQLTSQMNRDLFSALNVDLEWRGQIQDIPERRIRVSPNIEYNIRPTIRLFVQGGYERVKNFNFVNGVSQDNSLFELKFRYYY